MRIEPKNRVMPIFYFVFAVIALLFVSPIAHSFDAISTPSDASTHSEQVFKISFVSVKQNNQQSTLLSAIKPVGSKEPKKDNPVQNNLIKIVPSYASCRSHSFSPIMIKIYQDVISVYMSHQRLVWHKIKHQPLIKLLDVLHKQLDPLSYLLFS